ncbi:unnamed protein product [Mytilus coruscus]|uniref:HSPA12B n=1 Tax=Mytilus coruscus TaxID=42192 RepID=A0A6J8BKV6_MYTCO|nr:unnamed protein product [Mytilus coruscus]
MTDASETRRKPQVTPRKGKTTKQSSTNVETKTNCNATFNDEQKDIAVYQRNQHSEATQEGTQFHPVQTKGSQNVLQPTAINYKTSETNSLADITEEHDQQKIADTFKNKLAYFESSSVTPACNTAVYQRNHRSTESQLRKEFNHVQTRGLQNMQHIKTSATNRQANIKEEQNQLINPVHTKPDDVTQAYDSSFHHRRSDPRQMGKPQVLPKPVRKSQSILPPTEIDHTISETFCSRDNTQQQNQLTKLAHIQPNHVTQAHDSTLYLRDQRSDPSQMEKQQVQTKQMIKSSQSKPTETDDTIREIIRQRDDTHAQNQRKKPGASYRKQDALVVVAIDFGTSYSGYAYSFREEYKKDHNQIYTNQNWKSGDGLVTLKTPTAILFNKDESVHSFGYEAEQNYAQFVEENKSRDYIFLDKFKMKLFQSEQKSRRISSSTMLHDGRGNKISALYVFTESIRFLKNHFITSCRVASFKLKDDDVHWVLTVPAIWSDSAKQFMREAAKKAGISDKLLTLAYEPEAAAIYCKEMTVQRKVGNGRASMDTFKVGQKFIVLDCGGGTVDTTSYEIQENSHLKELERPTGGPWGGTMVDNEYITFLKLLFETDDWETYVKENPEDILEIKRKFEAKKKGISVSTDIVTIPYPISFRVKSLERKLADSSYSKSIQIRNEKIRFKREVIKRLFSKSATKIVQHLEMILHRNNLRGIETILMVGGYSESDILYEHIRMTFKHLTVICPPDASIAVMKGAVMFGHNPYSICERVCPRTYGITTNVPFDPEKHPLKFKDKVEGKDVCTDIFKVIVKVGQPLTVGESLFSVPCRPTRSTDCEATVEIYESILENPEYTFGEDARYLGKVCIPIPDTERGKDRLINVQMEFGYTEICVTVTEDGTNIQGKAVFKCLMS